MSDICTCGRPKYTPEDMRRWAEWQSNNVHAYDSGLGEPDWARTICWTTPGPRCNMRPLVKP